LEEWAIFVEKYSKFILQASRSKESVQISKTFYISNNVMCWQLGRNFGPNPLLSRFFIISSNSRYHNQKKVQDRVKILYRACRIAHQVAMEVILEVAPLGLLGVEIMIVTSFFVCVRNDTVIVRVTTATVCLTLTLVIRTLFMLAYKLTEDSVTFLDNFMNSSEENKKYLQSCQQLHVDVGKLFRLTRNTFPSVMHEIIINATISLLLAIPNTN